MDRRSAPALSVQCCRISTVTRYTKRRFPYQWSILTERSRREAVLCPLSMMRHRYGRYAVVTRRRPRMVGASLERHFSSRWYLGRLGNACCDGGYDPSFHHFPSHCAPTQSARSQFCDSRVLSLGLFWLGFWLMVTG